jgi:hypothetical protein
MSRKPPGRRRPHGTHRPREERTARRGSLRSWRTVAVLAALLLAAVAAWWLLHRGGAPLLPRRETVASPALLDSLRDAQAGSDWERATRWFQRAVDTEPRNPQFLLGLALARHNLLWTGAARDRGRTPSRTSLERTVTEQRVLALLDSAAACARDDAEWARIRRWSGQIYESMELPLDGLQVYLEALDRQPGFAPARDRAGAVLKMLRDPQARPPGGVTPALAGAQAKPGGSEEPGATAPTRPDGPSPTARPRSRRP